MPLSKVSVALILKEKTSSVHCVDEDAKVDEAVAEMNRLRIGSLLVKSGTAIVGIFTERDVLVRVLAVGRDSKVTIVKDVMTRDYKSIGVETSVEDAMQLMTEKRVRHLPVFNGSELAGMVSIGDVTRWLLKVNEMEAENLRKYVFSEYPA